MQPVFKLSNTQPKRMRKAYRVPSRVAALHAPAPCTVYSGEQAVAAVRSAPAQAHAAPELCGAPIPAQQYAVCTRRLAAALQGSKRNANTKGSVYAVFAEQSSAEAYMVERGLRLVATVVPL